jgi:metallo-beta-lactamase family protein
MVELEFFGAASTVTGSCHVLHLDGKAYLLDCGLFQGRRAESVERNSRFPLPPDRISGVLLSHAHIDHSGNIPGLVRRRFSGPVYATGATCDLCEVMLTDSAKIQEEDARFWNERRAKAPSQHIEPLYTAADALATRPLLRRVDYDAPAEFAPGATATWLEAGHILGSACMLLDLPNGAGRTKLLYTGDLGRFGMPILRDPVSPLPQCDYLITECTYADRRHSPADDLEQRLAWIIAQTRSVGGKVVIPAFSVGRTQHVVYTLAKAIAKGIIEPLPIFVDSPLSVHATEVFARHPECYDAEASDFWRSQGDIFGRDRITYITDVEQSKGLNSLSEPCVIIASSGMCEAGRVLHHLKNNVEDERNTVVVVGFMAQHTLGRRIVERREEIKIFGRMYKLLCRVEVLNGFSAHADSADFATALSPLAGKLKMAFAVHGEGPQPAAMQAILAAAGCPRVLAPKPGDRFVL